MVTTARVWDRLRYLGDDFNRRDFQFIVAFADSLPVYLSVKRPGVDPKKDSVVRGDELPIDEVMALVDDTSPTGLVRTLAKQYGIDNPRDLLTRALNYIGAAVPWEISPHFSDSLITTGSHVMRISEGAMRRAVHQAVFGEDFATHDPTLTAPGGLYTFAVKIQYSTPETETPRTEHLSIRASSPEEAKSIAARVAAEKDYMNVSIIDVEQVAYTGPNADGLVPVTAPTNVQPGATAGLVKPSDVSPVLPNVGVTTPRSG
jgi:hypothetical protein